MNTLLFLFSKIFFLLLLTCERKGGTCQRILLLTLFLLFASTDDVLLFCSCYMCSENDHIRHATLRFVWKDNVHILFELTILLSHNADLLTRLDSKCFFFFLFHIAQLLSYDLIIKPHVCSSTMMT